MQKRDAATSTEPRLPDEMGVWSDGGDIVWLPVRYYPSRRGAFRFARDNWQATPSEVYVTHAWMRFQPLEWEERWVECDGNDPGAFACWRLEAAWTRMPQPSTGPLVPLTGYSLSITIEDGYVKAYANPPDGRSIISYGLQGRSRDDVWDAVLLLVGEYVEANRV